MFGQGWVTQIIKLEVGILSYREYRAFSGRSILTPIQARRVKVSHGLFVETMHTGDETSAGRYPEGWDFLLRMPLIVLSSSSGIPTAAQSNIGMAS